jgi:membrane protein YqaA with SNARE-associated domain
MTATTTAKPAKAGWLQRGYDWVVAFSTHPNAIWIMALISFAESSVFPLTPLPLLIPMCLAQPRRAWYFCAVAAIASALGGVVGYAIGHLLYDTVGLWIITTYGLVEQAASLRERANDYWIYILLTKGVTPIPFKLVTIMSGLIDFNFWTFLWASFFARFTYFFVFGLALRLFGEQIREFIEKRLKLATFILLFFLIGGFVLIRYI